MISYTRHYVYPKGAIMGQASKKRLLMVLNHLQENTRGHNPLFIIIISKDSKQTFKNADMHLPSLFVIIEVFPPLSWTCSLHLNPPMISNLSLFQSSLQAPFPSHFNLANGDYDHRCCPPTPSSVSSDN